MAEKAQQVTWYWENIPALMTGISRKSAGWMNADAVDLERGAIGKANRDKFFADLGFDPNKAVAITGLKHTTNVIAVDFSDAGQVIYGTDGVDGLSTGKPGLILASTVADCFPVYFYAPVAQVVAIAHIGWKGARDNMAQSMLAHLIENYPTLDLSKLKVLIGPGIQSCHFEVQEDVASQFRPTHMNDIQQRGGKTYIDLPEVIRHQLAVNGVSSDNVEIINECVYCLEDKYFSFRRDNPDKPQSMVAFIVLRNENK